MTERLDLFATPVLKVRPPDAAELNPPLIAAIHAERRRNPGVQRSNIGGWHSAIGMTSWAGPPSHRLAEFAVQSVGPHMIDVAGAGKRDFRWSVDMWANINRPGDANQLHCHTGSFWSGVYYPDPGGADEEDGGGELVLEDPRYPGAFMAIPDLLFRTAEGAPMATQVTIRPEAGLLVLFPSWLRHSVRPHRGTRERISIAVNLRLTGVEPGQAGG